jgi:N-acetylglucosaminylphosphatidylinositol deacetylase
MTAQWDPQRVSDVLLAATAAAAAGATDGLPTAARIRESMQQNASAEQRRQQLQRPNIDMLVTFDRHGVSSHPNHCAVHASARVFLDALKRRRKEEHGASATGSGGRTVAVYTLTSVGLARKYTSVLDIWPTVVQAIAKKAIASVKQNKTFRPESSSLPAADAAASPQPMLLLASSPAQVRQAQGAMTRAHQSQMVWFRWGWILFSRYMAVNDLRLLEDNEQR